MDFFKTPAKSPTPSEKPSERPSLQPRELNSLSLPSKRLKMSPSPLPPSPSEPRAEAAESEFDLPSFTLPDQVRDSQGNRPGHPNYDPTTLWVPVDRKRTPAQEQYWNIKSKHFDAILLFKLGKFYELFYQDAIITQKLLELNWMGDKRKCHVGFPEKVLEKNAAKLVDCGYKVVVVEQTETPEQLKQRNLSSSGKKDKAVSRAVTDIFTKGTYIDEGDASAACEQRFLATIVQEKDQAAFVLTECNTSKVFTLDCTVKELYTAISQTQPVEIVYNSALISPGLLRRLKELPSKPLLSHLRNPASWDDLSLTEHFPMGLPTALKNITNPLLRKAIKGTCSYLNSLLIGEKVLQFADWEPYNSTLTRYMTLDFRALDALEVLEVTYGSGTKKEGSLLHFVDKTVTPYGRKMMKRWVCLPLMQLSAIQQRQTAVHELYLNPVSVSVFDKCAGALQDLERLLIKLARYCVQQNSSAIYFENIQTKQVKDFELVLKQLHAMENVHLTMSTLDFQAERLKSLVRDLFPDLDSIKREFEGVFRWVGERVEPAPDCCSEYEQAKAQEDLVKEELFSYLRQQKTRLKCSSLSFVDIKYRFELEVPVEVVAGSSKPPEYELTSAKQGYERFHTPAIKSLVLKLERAEEQLKSAFKPYLGRVFSRLLSHRPTILQAISVVGELDCLCALAKAAGSYKSNVCIPQFEERSTAVFETTSLRHPVLAAKVAEFIPNDVRLTQTQPAMILTGPNMGGKSTLLRQVCVATILAQIGALVPAKSLRLSLVDRIFTRMGAKDDLFLGKSTFAMEMEEAVEVFRSASASSLVIMDELGRGTGTSDGAAIAYVTLKRILQDFGCRTIFTTHYYMLMDQIRELEGVQLWHMSAAVNTDEVLFLYKLAEGVCPASFGLNVARLAGVPPAIIARAKVLSSHIAKDLQSRRILHFLLSHKDDSNLLALLQEFVVRLG